MNQNMVNLRSNLALEREALKRSTGLEVVFGENGPVSLALVEALIRVIEEQHTRIMQLEERLGVQPPKPF